MDRRPVLAGLVCGLLGACTGGGSGQALVGSGVAGVEQPKPGGGSYFLDQHRSGQANELRVVEIQWGRLVDIHDIGAAGSPSVEPVFEDMLVDENVITDGLNYVLERNPVTQRERLVVLRIKGEADSGSGTFASLLRDATRRNAPIAPKRDDGTEPGPLSLVARNATLGIRFDDLLDDGAEAARRLSETVRVLTGYPPNTPFTAHILFDPNHGGVVDGQFHSTRILVDLTVSEAESNDLLSPLPINSLGLPASNFGSPEPSVAIRLPTKVDFGSGQFFVIRNVGGAALATTENGPVDLTVATEDIVRAARAGRDDDANLGFLLDPELPRVVANWSMTITDAAEFTGPSGGQLYRVDLRFNTSCQKAPAPGDILTVGSRFLEVRRPAPPPDAQGEVDAVEVRILSGGEISTPTALIGTGEYGTAFDPLEAVHPACWFGIFPPPLDEPASAVSSSSQFLVRFSEPMKPSSIRAFETFQVIRGPLGTLPGPNNIIIANLDASADFQNFTHTPVLPMANAGNLDYVISLRADEGGVTDLSGNPLADPVPQVGILLDSSEPVVSNGGLIMLFDSRRELDPEGTADFRGQLVYDSERGTITGRPVSRATIPIDQGQPTVGFMTPFTPGLQTPLSPLGSKMQCLWRYADAGWRVLDETKYDVDVIGMGWSTARNRVLSDFYDRFEMSLAHSRRLPDERGSVLRGPAFRGSGLKGPGFPFQENVLLDGGATQEIVHARTLGYRIQPADLYRNVNGTPIVPFPMNRGGGTPITYTWRDTTILARAGPFGAGIPMSIEVGNPLFLEQGPAGNVAVAGQVPSVGLPLLWEIKCFPSNTGFGFNPLRIRIALNTYSTPNFRNFSTGGTNVAGQPVIKDPDFEQIPSGGFNPGSTPPGKTTTFVADSSFYLGQLDIVLRVTRGHTKWIDSLLVTPNYLEPVTEPRPSEQPSGSSIVMAYRGADSFDVDAGIRPFDATYMDAYGDAENVTVAFHDGVGTWADEIKAIDGARYFQIRFTFISNIETGGRAELDALGIAFVE